jgi:hypothetical protein
VSTYSVDEVKVIDQFAAGALQKPEPCISNHGTFGDISDIGAGSWYGGGLLT